MARTLHHTIRWPACSPDGRAPQSPTRGDVHAIEPGDTHWPSCLRLDQHWELLRHPLLLRAAETDSLLPDRVLRVGYVVTDERTGTVVGLVLRARWDDVELTTWRGPDGCIEAARKPHSIYAMRSRPWITADTLGRLHGPGATVRENLIRLAREVRIPVVREEPEPESLDADDAAALEGFGQ